MEETDKVQNCTTDEGNDSDCTVILDVDPKKKYLCTFENCNAQFLRPSRLLRHTRQHTGERPYVCTFNNCDKAYTNSSHLKRHEETHSNLKHLYCCPYCPKTVSFLHNLKRHCERMHGDKNDKLSCTECGKRFRKTHCYQEHVAAHANESVIYKCEHCNTKFDSHYKLRKHERGHSKAGFKCKLCPSSFPTKTDFCSHLKSAHSAEHFCEICNKLFIRKSLSEKHISMHANDNMFTCSYENCYSMYYSQSNLDNHIKTKHLGIRFTCDICKKEYTSKLKLRIHIVDVHINKKLENKVTKVPRKKPVKPRKDKGKPVKSIISKLIGVDFPYDVEKRIMNRQTLLDEKSEEKIKEMVEKSLHNCLFGN